MTHRLSLSLALLFLAASSLWAQPMMRTPAERARQLKERLFLTEEQTIAVEIIFEERQKEVTAKMDSLMGDREAMRAFMTSQAAKTDEEIEGLLNEDQKKKYEELKKERRERRGGQRRGN
jgi:Spy/CpxP family protein refolding chaperone